MADFISHYRLPVILIAQNYLGSINHTLLSIEVLKSRGMRLLGIVMNGGENKYSETFIKDYTRVPIIARIPHFDKPDNDSITKCANEIKGSMSLLFQK